MPNIKFKSDHDKIRYGLEFLNEHTRDLSLEEIEERIPPGLFELFAIQNIFMAEIQKIYRQLDITTPAELEHACINHRLLLIDSFDQASQTRILTALRTHRQNNSLFLFSDAWLEAHVLVGYLKSHLGKQVEIVGSLRRCCETVKNINLVTAAVLFEKLATKIKEYPNFDSFISQDKNSVIFFLKNGMSCEIVIAESEDFQNVRRFYTGSFSHNKALKEFAEKKGFSLEVNGLYQNRIKIEIKSEAAVFETLGIEYIEPEMREGINEIQQAEENNLPQILVFEQIRGTFHCHTLYSDGVTSTEEMVKRAEELGLEYIGISEHSHSFPHTLGLKKNRVLKQRAEIRELQKRYKIKILMGIESDILLDGELDYDNSLLEKLDFVIGSIHEPFDQNKETMTKRVINAFENPYFDMLGHPTGRFLPYGEPFEIDMPGIIEAASSQGVVIELNSSPRRLDIDWRFGTLLKKNHCLVSINPDAHSPAALDDLHYGIGIARKAGLGSSDILNTRPADQVLNLLRRYSQKTK
jgi:DNA polymerase (family 10)